MALRRRDLKLDRVTSDDASPEVGEVYGRVKETLRTGVVNLVWEVFATKPRFLQAVWAELEPAVDQGFMEAAEGIRALAIERVRETAPVPDHRGLLGDDLARANEELRVFLETNPRLLILMCALQRSWRGEQVGGLRPAEPAERGVPRWHPPIETADAGLFQGKVRGLYEEIADTLDLPEPNTDYKVLGRWPDYLQQAWSDLRAFIPTESWRGICATVDWIGEQAALALPAKVSVSPNRAGELGLDPREVDEVGRWIDTFHSLLPGVIVNDSFFWVGMLGGVERLPAPAPTVLTADAGAEAPAPGPPTSATAPPDAAAGGELEPQRGEGGGASIYRGEA